MGSIFSCYSTPCVFFNFKNSLIQPKPTEIYECEELSKNEQTDAVDFSNFRIHQENDTHTYLDGSVKFKLGFSRLPGRVYLEHYVRGKWIIQIFDRTYMDMCISFHNPVEIFYNQSKHFPNCPIKSGVSRNLKYLKYFNFQKKNLC